MVLALARRLTNSKDVNYNKCPLDHTIAGPENPRTPDHNEVTNGKLVYVHCQLSWIVREIIARTMMLPVQLRMKPNIYVLMEYTSVLLSIPRIPTQCNVEATSTATTKENCQIRGLDPLSCRLLGISC